MVQMTLAANEVSSVEHERWQTQRKDRPDIDVQNDTLNTRNVLDIDGEDAEIANEDGRGVQN